MDEYKTLDHIFQKVAEKFIEKRNELCEMDAFMGDGDLGITMAKGFGALPQIIQEENTVTDDLGKILMKSGMKMSNIVPSTMGTLMSSGLIEGGKRIKGKTVLDEEGLVLFLEGFSIGIERRGKCQIGDRTVLDAINEATIKAKMAFAEGKNIGEIAEAGFIGAEEGVKKTRNMIPKFGKAAIHITKAKELPDQGALAGKYLIEGIMNGILQ